jgi:hypothetical protein
VGPRRVHPRSLRARRQLSNSDGSCEILLTVNDARHTDVWLLAQGVNSMPKKKSRGPCAAKKLADRGDTGPWFVALMDQDPIAAPRARSRAFFQAVLYIHPTGRGCLPFTSRMKTSSECLPRSSQSPSVRHDLERTSRAPTVAPVLVRYIMTINSGHMREANGYPRSRFQGRVPKIDG